ncbi:MAG: hypothetical protein ABH858_07710, partial [Candidatus Omnitrophota bacterium]
AKKINKGNLTAINPAALKKMLQDNDNVDLSADVAKLILRLEMVTSEDQRESMLSRRRVIQREARGGIRMWLAMAFSEIVKVLTKEELPPVQDIPGSEAKIQQAKNVRVGHKQMRNSTKYVIDPGKYSETEKELSSLAHSIARNLGVEQVLLLNSEPRFAGAFGIYKGKKTMFLKAQIALGIGLEKGGKVDEATDTVVHELAHLVEDMVGKADSSKVWNRWVLTDDTTVTLTHQPVGGFAEAMKYVAGISLANYGLEIESGVSSASSSLNKNRRQKEQGWKSNNRQRKEIDRIKRVKKEKELYQRQQNALHRVGGKIAGFIGDKVQGAKEFFSPKGGENQQDERRMVSEGGMDREVLDASTGQNTASGKDVPLASHQSEVGLNPARKEMFQADLKKIVARLKREAQALNNLQAKGADKLISEIFSIEKKAGNITSVRQYRDLKQALDKIEKQQEQIRKLIETVRSPQEKTSRPSQIQQQRSSVSRIIEEEARSEARGVAATLGVNLNDGEIENMFVAIFARYRKELERLAQSQAVSNQKRKEQIRRFFNGEESAPTAGAKAQISQAKQLGFINFRARLELAEKISDRNFALDICLSEHSIRDIRPKINQAIRTGSIDSEGKAMLSQKDFSGRGRLPDDVKQAREVQQLRQAVSLCDPAGIETLSKDKIAKDLSGQASLLGEIIDIIKGQLYPISSYKITHRSTREVTLLIEEEGNLESIFQGNTIGLNIRDEWYELKLVSIREKRVTLFSENRLLPEKIEGGSFYVEPYTGSEERQRAVMEEIAKVLKEKQSTGIDILD